jgi:hypothetical protein
MAKIPDTRKTKPFEEVNLLQEVPRNKKAGGRRKLWVAEKHWLANGPPVRVSKTVSRFERERDVKNHVATVYGGVYYTFKERDTIWVIRILSPQNEVVWQSGNYEQYKHLL